MAATNSEMLQESPILHFACLFLENPDTVYLEVVGIPPPPKRTITKKIDFCNYYENKVANKDKLDNDSDGGVDPFFNDIADKKVFEDGRDNPVSMEGEGHVETEVQYGKFVPLSNDKIDVLDIIIRIQYISMQGSTEKISNNIL